MLHLCILCLKWLANTPDFVSEILYIWNLKNPISQWTMSFEHSANIFKLVAEIQKWEKYNVLSEPLISPAKSHALNKADLIIFSSNPEKTRKTIDSAIMYMRGLNSIFVLYQISNEQEAKRYEVLRNNYPHLHFLEYNLKQSITFIQFINKYLVNIGNYIICTTDDISLLADIDTSFCIVELERIFFLWILSWTFKRTSKYATISNII